MNQLRAGAILNYVIIILNILVGLGYTPYMLKCLGQNEYGLFSLVSSVIAYLTILDFGFGNAIVRYASKFRAECKFDEQWRMFGMFVVVYSVIGLIAFAGGLGLYFNIDLLFDKTMSTAELSQARTMMLLLTVNLAVTFPFSVFGSIITAYEDFVFQRVVNIIRILLATAVMIAVLYGGYKAVALVVVQTVFNLLTLLINFLYCKYKIRIKIVFERFNWTFLKEISIYSFWIFLNAIMDKVYWGTGQFVLGSICGTVAVAVFSVAILLQQMYFQFSTAVANVLLPRITSMVVSGNDARAISDLFIRTGRLQCIVMALILSAFAAFGRAFINCWAGSDYSGAYPITLIFFVTLFPPMIQNTGIAILQARNQMKFRSILYFIMAMLSLAGQVILSKYYGALGCAVSIGAALVLGHGLIMNVYYQQSQKINILQFWREILSMIVVPVILTIIAVLSTHWVNYSSVPVMIAGMAIFTLSYIILMWHFTLNDYEKSIVVGSLSRKRY